MTKPGRPFASLASLFPCLCLIASACGEPDAPALSHRALLASASAGDVPGCQRWPQRATRPRKVVVSHPYDENGDGANNYEVLDLSEDGKLTAGRGWFQMGRLAFGRIVFTPDGMVGMAAQDDGSVGVFAFDELGVARVVHAGFTGLGYAANLVMDPSGERVYVLDNEWREYGGGIYSARIGCDGTLTSEGQLAPAKLPAGLAFLSGSAGGAPRAVLAAHDVLSSAAGNSVHLLGWPSRLPATPTVVGGADAFGDDLSIVSAVARTPDDRYVLIGDNSEFSGVDNRISVIAVEGDKLRPVQLLTPVEDPVAIVLSPWNNAGLVVSGYGNAVFRLTYSAAATKPFVNKGQPTYIGRRPQLPSGAELIERGSLRGRVFIAELEGVRQLAFGSDGAVQDLGLTAIGSELNDIVGAIGVQP